MKNLNVKKILPHVIAIVVFLLVAVIFCKPALEPGVVMQQSDFTQADAMKHQSVLYKEAHGTYPLWVTSMFGGMPAYNIIYEGFWSPFYYVDKAFQFWLPKPLNFFFLSCICFYILCMCMRIRPYVAILGSLAFAYSTFSPILAAAGHDTELLALAYAPALIGGVILLFNKKYISGFVFTALFATMHLMQNHQQISYYTLMIIAIMTLFFAVKWIKEKDTKHMLKAISLAIGGAAIGAMINAILLLPVVDYAKYSKRGGVLVMDGKSEGKTAGADKNKTNGLSRDYAFQWSYGKMESLSLLFPGITGYGSHASERDQDYSIFPKLSETSNVSKYLQETLNVPEDQAGNIATNLSTSIYWGDKPFTTGSNYLGASICFLFILGMFLLDNKHKWWIFTASIVGIILAMGKNMPLINNFLFDYLPIYNKFRTPEMALVIPQILFPILAVLTTQKVLDNDDPQMLKKLRLSVFTIAGIFVIAGLLYFTLDYSKENKERTAAVNAAFATPDSTLNGKMQEINQKFEPLVDNRVYENFLQQSKGDTKVARAVVTALRKDRQNFLGGDILHSLLFVALTVALIGLFIYRKINAVIVLIGLPLLTALDLIPFDTHYINEKSFDNAEKYHANEFPQSNADLFILKDKDPNFRVFNVSGSDPFQEAKTSYYHNSIGGYHPAKLGIYDDLITYQLSGQPNLSVLNMLNTKYIIQPNQKGDNTTAQVNMQALGNCWFVKGVRFVNGPVEEMKALDNFDPKDTAIIDNSFKNIITGFAPADSAASIKQTAFENMAIKYESNSNAANVAVFSEIYYKDWNAYIDGKLTPIAKANYVLRALLIPAGKHTIEFKFEPKVYKTSYTISLLATWLLVILLIGYAAYVFKQSCKQIEQ
ncbi:YfhO family protein [Ferruginibacter paludis]|uniref:YfhO family protein n=1 Tax=Ferruginibacter paludis TaxID=1310417 RepID=UPI0025B2889F|nr:YfhO family protein [Ferruginibacter paludis]MDN3657153.1 YfhO family protein [Ferruginibacter paludis]